MMGTKKAQDEIDKETVTMAFLVWKCNMLLDEELSIEEHVHSSVGPGFTICQNHTAKLIV